jgi:carbamoyl-phosphate synthase large subunit
MRAETFGWLAGNRSLVRSTSNVPRTERPVGRGKREPLSPVTVLATSVGNDGFPSVIEALRASGERTVRVVGVDARREAAGLSLADVGAVVPTRSEDAGLMARLAALCREYDVDVLLPLSTQDQDFFAAQTQEFARIGVVVATSAAEAVATANDKQAILDTCQRHGIACPRYHRVSSLDELQIAVRALGFPDRPVVIKLNRGTGMWGVKIVDPQLDARAKLFDRDNLRVRYEDVIAGLRNVDVFPPMHVAEYLPGREFSVDLLAWKGEVLASVVRLRLATLYGLATHAVVVDDLRVDAVARQLVSVLGLSYVANVQLRGDERDDPRIIEVNPRIPGTIGLTVAAGVNMPYLAVKLALGEAIGPIPSPVHGTEAVRYWTLAVQRSDQS